MDITKFEIDELNNDITNATKIVRQKIITNRLSGKVFHIALIFSLSTFIANIYTTKIVNAMIKNSFHIHINDQNVPSRPNPKVTSVCKKNCSNNTHKNTLVITMRFFLIRFSIQRLFME